MDTKLQIDNILKNDINNFEKCLEKIISTQDIFLQKDLSNFMFNNPKRLRPIFTFLFARALKVENESVLKIALAQELIHSASLIHDDIIDEEKTRRGEETFYYKYGAKKSVILGDLLLSLSLEILAETNIEIVKIFSEKIKKTILGELKQNSQNYKTINEADYFGKTFNKTGNLFLAGLESLFVLKETSKEIQKNYINFLKNFSIAFQIKNDLDDFLKKESSDIKNGNYTLPVLYFCIDNKLEDLAKNFDFTSYTNQTKNKIEEHLKKAIESLGNLNNDTEIIANFSKWALGSLN